MMGSPSDFYSVRSDRKPALLVKYQSGREELLKFHNSKDRDVTWSKLLKLNIIETVKRTYWESEWR